MDEEKYGKERRKRREEDEETRRESYVGNSRESFKGDSCVREE